MNENVDMYVLSSVATEYMAQSFNPLNATLEESIALLV